MSDKLLQLSKMDDWTFKECKAVYSSLVIDWFEWKSDLVDELFEESDRSDLARCIARFVCRD